MQKFNFSYDEVNDDLFLFSSFSKSKGSVELGDVILDYNAKKELVGVQLMNASALLCNMVSEDKSVIKEVLSSLEECKVDVKVKGGILILKLYLVSKAKELIPIISVPSIRQSPALTYR